MKKSTMNTMAIIFLSISMFFLLMNFIFDNKLFTGFQFLSLGLMFLFQYLISKATIINSLSKTQLMASILMISISAFEIVSIIVKAL